MTARWRFLKAAANSSASVVLPAASTPSMATRTGRRLQSVVAAFGAEVALRQRPQLSVGL